MVDIIYKTEKSKYICIKLLGVKYSKQQRLMEDKKENNISNVDKVSGDDKKTYKLTLYFF